MVNLGRDFPQETVTWPPASPLAASSQHVLDESILLLVFLCFLFRVCVSPRVQQEASTTSYAVVKMV